MSIRSRRLLIKTHSNVPVNTATMGISDGETDEGNLLFDFSHT